MSVANIDADICNYNGNIDFQVYTEYISENIFTLVLRRLDKEVGWDRSIDVLVVYKDIYISQFYKFDPSDQQEARKTITLDFTIKKADAITPIETYKKPLEYYLERIDRKTFNKLFNTNIIILPTSLYAVGLIDKWAYIYGEDYSNMHMIELTINHILSVNSPYRKFHFIICAHDGYLEENYYGSRVYPKLLEKESCKNISRCVLKDDLSSYPVYYNNKYVLAMCNMPGVAYTLTVPDRYYFYLNHHNQYRSIHKGVPFKNKINKIVFGSRREYGSKYNFINRRDIEINQREYFYSDAVSKDNIVAPNWIDRNEMLQYKYLLDIDGNASTWDATAWKLNSNSVILKTESVWKQWFYNGYFPWVHYVPVANDFSDLQEKYKWCEEHQEECEKIVENAKKLFQTAYQYSNVVNHTLQVIQNIVRIKPSFTIDNKNVYFISNDDVTFTKYHVNIIKDKSIKNIILDVSDVIKDEDIIIFINGKQVDMNIFNEEIFYKAWKEFNKKIIFASETNLWPGDLESYRSKLDALAPTGCRNKYLQTGVFFAEAGELRKIVNDCFSVEPVDQAYFTKVYLLGKYSIGLDYWSKFIFSTYGYSREEITRDSSTSMFINYNGGR
jgi:hypothetical protein